MILNDLLNSNMNNSCIFTICTKSYIGLANALGASLKDNQVKADFVIIVVDHDISNDTSEYGTLVTARQLCRYSEQDWTERTFKYDLVELCTSIKACCFQHLFKHGYKNVVYFDPDIIVFDNLENIFSSLSNYDIIATPHRLTHDNDLPSRGGVFNLGFLAARGGAAADRVMSWWDARLKNYSINDPLRGFFTDQKWMDHLPVLLRNDHFLVSDHPGMNLAPWNLEERELKKQNNIWHVRLKNQEHDWIPVSFVHFSAFNYQALQNGLEQTKVISSDTLMPGFKALTDELASYLQKGGFTNYSSIPYEYASYSDGLVIHPGHRRIFQRLLEKNRHISNPFDVNGVLYSTLRQSGLLASISVSTKPSIHAVKGQVGRAVTILDFLSRIIVRVLGYQRYWLMSKLLIKYFHPTNQIRLSKNLSKEIDLDYF